MSAVSLEKAKSKRTTILLYFYQCSIYIRLTTVNLAHQTEPALLFQLIIRSVNCFPSLAEATNEQTGILELGVGDQDNGIKATS